MANLKKKKVTKKRRKKRKKGKKQNSNLMLILVLALLFISVIFVISNKDGIDESQNKKQIIVKKDEKVKRKKKKLPFFSDKKQQKEEVEKEEEVISVENISDAIVEVARQIGVNTDLISTKIRKDGIYFYLPINRENVDLYFANMILTGKLEAMNATILSGESSSNNNYQILKVFEPIEKENYIIKIYYAKPGVYKKDKPELAIVVDDFGLIHGKLLSQWFDDVPLSVTFAIMPDLPYSVETMNKGVANGRDTIIHMPMEPISYPRNNPGKNAIYVDLSDKEIRKRLNGYIQQLPLCIGANNHMGSLATADKTVMKSVLETLKEHNLFFLDSWTTASSIGFSMAQQMSLPTIRRHIFLDDPDVTDKTLQKRLARLKKLQSKQKQVVVITHCSNRARIDNLLKFISAAEKMGFELVSVSDMFKNKLPEIL